MYKEKRDIYTSLSLYIHMYVYIYTHVCSHAYIYTCTYRRAGYLPTSTINMVDRRTDTLQGKTNSIYEISSFPRLFFGRRGAAAEDGIAATRLDFGGWSPIYDGDVLIANDPPSPMMAHTQRLSDHSKRQRKSKTMERRSLILTLAKFFLIQ